jgi:hypothetical protein
MQKQVNFMVLTLLLVTPVYAVCPLCTFAVGAGIGLTQWLGIDDTITGLWVGGLVVSMIIWTICWLNKRNVHFLGRKILITLLYFTFILGSLYYKDVIGHPLNKLWGMDRLLLGIVVGSITFFVGHLTYEYVKKNNNGCAYFPLQKVIMPVMPLVLLSIFFYFLTK